LRLDCFPTLAEAADSVTNEILAGRNQKYRHECGAHRSRGFGGAEISGCLMFAADSVDYKQAPASPKGQRWSPCVLSTRPPAASGSFTASTYLLGYSPELHAVRLGALPKNKVARSSENRCGKSHEQRHSQVAAGATGASRHPSGRNDDVEKTEHDR
jgi:hypothetical protein